jgi:hypothetical protein
MDERMAGVLLKFTKILKSGVIFYLFEGFEKIKCRWELPCEYLSGPHFAAWDEILLYSNGESLFSLIPGNEISEEEYRKLMYLVEKGKERLKEINERKDMG